MNINIRATQLTTTPAINDYVTKRLDKVSKLLSEDPTVQCDIELAKTTSHHNKGDIFKAEIHIVGIGKNFYATSEKADLYSAIDEVRDVILDEIKSKKEKSSSMVRRGGARVKAMVKGMWPFGRNN